MPGSDTPRILKSNDARNLVHGIAFNYEDLKERCNEHVQQIRQQTQDMIRKAHAEAEEIRQRAYAEAYEAGNADAMRDVEAEIQRRSDESAEQKAAAKLNSLAPALEQAAAALREERDRWLSQWETTAVRASIAIAEKLLRRQLDLHPEWAQDMIAEALQLAAGSPRIEVRMHPQDTELLGNRASDVVRQLAACGHAEIVADLAVSRGGCLIQTQHGTIDARVETMLDRIAAELTETSAP